MPTPTHTSKKRPLEDSDSEWEYEYHPTETETYYVTLDLSSNPNNTYAAHAPKKTPPARKKKIVSALKSAEPIEPTTTTDATPYPSTTKLPPDNIQIIDLHTRNPVISYRSQIYDCDWSRNLGTDLHFVSVPSPDVPNSECDTSTTPEKTFQGLSESLPCKPIAQGDGWALLAKTGIKLVGRAIRATEKPITSLNRARTTNNSAPVTEKHGNPRSIHSTSDASVQFTEAPKPTPIVDPELAGKPAVRIPLSISATYAKQNQATFLERLIAAKRARGERDRVFIGIGRTYADGWDPNLAASLTKSDQEDGREVAEGEGNDEDKGMRDGSPRKHSPPTIEVGDGQDSSVEPQLLPGQRRKRGIYKRKGKGAIDLLAGVTPQSEPTGNQDDQEDMSASQSLASRTQHASPEPAIGNIPDRSTSVQVSPSNPRTSDTHSHPTHLDDSAASVATSSSKVKARHSTKWLNQSREGKAARGGVSIGGLFRDYVPMKGDGEGAEFRKPGDRGHGSGRGVVDGRGRVRIGRRGRGGIELTSGDEKRDDDGREN